MKAWVAIGISGMLVGACVLDRTGRMQAGAGGESAGGDGGEGLALAGMGGTGLGDATVGGGGIGGDGGTAICGDGVVEGSEACDDANQSAGDGCSDCLVDLEHTCVGQPSVCAPIQTEIELGPGLGVSIRDQADYYDGSLQRMDCVVIPHAGLIGTFVSSAPVVRVGIDHSFLGDLIIKLVSPEGTIVTLMSRPGADEPADSYSESPTGDSSNLDPAFPITFTDNVQDPAETMGNGINGSDNACEDDARCTYQPSPDKGPGIALADFIGDNPVGDWRVCVADGDNVDSGSIENVILTVRAEAPGAQL